MGERAGVSAVASPSRPSSILSALMRTAVLGLAVVVVLTAPAVSACGGSDKKASSPTTTSPAGTTTATGAPTTGAGGTTTAADDTTTAADDTTTTANEQDTGDAIALGEALGYDLTNDDAACIKSTVGDATVALLDENDIGALPAKVQGDLFQALAKCAANTIVQSFVSSLPTLLAVNEDQASCVGQAYVSIYTDNRKAAEQGSLTFDETDKDVQSYVRDKLAACLPADKVDEFLSEQTG